MAPTWAGPGLFLYTRLVCATFASHAMYFEVIRTNVFKIESCPAQSIFLLTGPCESVQILTNPDRYSRICRNSTSRKYSLKFKYLLIKKCSTRLTRLPIEV